MAHVGKIYPYAAQRDYCFNTILMQYLPLRFVIRKNLLIGGTNNPKIDQDWFSDEPIIDTDIGEHKYVWQPGGFSVEPVTLEYRVRLRFTEFDPRRFELKATWKGIDRNWGVNGQQQAEYGIPPAFFPISQGDLANDGYVIDFNFPTGMMAAVWEDF